MSHRGHVPERRCIACGARGPQESFIRFHIDREGERPRVVADEPGEARRGRGAYICPRLLCYDKAVKKRAFQRVFRSSVAVDSEELRANVERRLGQDTGMDGR